MDIGTLSSVVTKSELLAAARAEGFRPSDRLVSDWVSVGLLDKAQKHGLGRGKGTTATWPRRQLELFLALLNKRQEVKQIATLCNIPVALWLWWGDEYVPTRQARRALETWAHTRQRASSWRAALETATQLVERFTHPEASQAARKRLVHLIAQAAYGKPFDRVAVLAAFREVFDPRNDGRVLGPPGIEFVPEHYILLTEARLAAVAALRGSTLDDEAYEWARREYRASRRDYEQMIPRIAADSEAADAFLIRTDSGVVVPDSTLEQLFNQACVDLLTMLGIYLKQREGDRSRPT